MNILQIVSKLDTSDEAQDVISMTRFFTLNGHKIIVVSEKSVFVKEIDEVGARHRVMALRPNVFLIPVFIFKLSRIILKENIQIVHARDALSSFIAFFASRFTERAFVATVYGHYTKSFLKRSRFWAKRVICFGESQAQYLAKIGVISQNKARVIPPAVDIDKFTPPFPPVKRRPEGEKTEPTPSPQRRARHLFVIAAELPVFSQEATQIFIRTVSILSRTIYRIKVFIIDKPFLCEKDTKEKLKLLIRRHSLRNIVEFSPETDPISGMDLFAQINTGERISVRLLLQALGRGIPVLTTDTDRIRDYLGDDKTAMLSKGNDPKELAAKILDLYRNEALRKEISAKAVKFVGENFNAKKIMESTLILYENALASTNILIIKIGALGDVILATPSVKAIREKFPKAKIKVLVGLDNREVFTNSHSVDEVIVCDFKERDKGLKGLLRVAGRLRAEDFDLVIDLQNNKKSHVLSFLSCAPKRYGYDNGKLSFLLNRKVKDIKLALDPVKHQSKTLGLLGIFNIDKTPELWPAKEDEEWADNFLKSHWVKGDTKLAAVNIGSSARWVTKLWPVECFAKVCNKLAKNFGIRVILIGRERSTPRIEEFLKRAKYKPIDALNKTNIPRLACLVKRCDLLLSSDSAPLHVAASVNTPFVGLFGPTDPARHAPSVKKSIVIKKDFPCAPCYRTHCDRKYICMRSIKPDEVYEAMLKLLGIKAEAMSRNQNLPQTRNGGG